LEPYTRYLTLLLYQRPSHKLWQAVKVDNVTAYGTVLH